MKISFDPKAEIQNRFNNDVMIKPPRQIELGKLNNDRAAITKDNQLQALKKVVIPKKAMIKLE